MAAKSPITRTASVVSPAQPYQYRRRELTEPDWTRFPGWRTVTPAEWASAQWQRAHCVKSVKQLHDVLGDMAPEEFYADLAEDMQTHATMSMLLPPQMLNTMLPHEPSWPMSLIKSDPVRRYMLPIASDRHRVAQSPPRQPRFPARARHVGGGGADPSLPNQGTGRVGLYLSAVLRTLHPDGPGRHLYPDGHQAAARG